MSVPATLYLMVGLPGAGKTTAARRIEEEQGALRLTPDEWMIPLFGEPSHGDSRDILEGRLISLGLQALSLGVAVMADFGLWSRDERTCLRWLAGCFGAQSSVVYLGVTPTEQRERIRSRSRWSRAAETTFALSDEDLRGFDLTFEAPTPDEWQTQELDPPPSSYGSWAGWAKRRWPSLELPQFGQEPLV